MPERVVTLFGATGYTGRLLAAEACRQGLPVRLAGRRREPLETLATDLGITTEVAVADVDDRASMARLAESSTVLLTAVGPYDRLGRPVVEAALTGGCHYVDITAETIFLDWVYGQQRRAEEAGVVLCPGCGIDGLPGDLLAALAMERIGQPLLEARVASLVRGAWISAGSVRSAMLVAAGGGAAWVDGELVDEPVGAHRWRVPFPEPLGPRGAVSAPLPEAVTLGRSTGAPTARAYAVVPGSVAVPLVAGPLDRAARRLAGGSLSRLAERALDHLPEGPSETRRRAARVAALAEVVGPGGAGRAWGRARDLYATTARTAVGMARRLLHDGDPPVGARTPSQVLGEQAGAFLDETGVRWARL